MKTTINGKKVVQLGDKMDRKALNRAKKTFSKGDYSLRVTNLKTGEDRY